MQQWIRLSLTAKVLIGMVAGLLMSLVMRYVFTGVGFVEDYLVNGIFNVVGQIFLTSLKMIVVPLIFTVKTMKISTFTTLAKPPELNGLFFLLPRPAGAAFLLPPHFKKQLYLSPPFDGD